MSNFLGTIAPITSDISFTVSPDNNVISTFDNSTEIASDIANIINKIKQFYDSSLIETDDSTYIKVSFDEAGTHSFSFYVDSETGDLKFKYNRPTFRDDATKIDFVVKKRIKIDNDITVGIKTPTVYAPNTASSIPFEVTLPDGEVIEVSSGGILKSPEIIALQSNYSDNLFQKLVFNGYTSTNGSMSIAFNGFMSFKLSSYLSVNFYDNFVTFEYKYLEGIDSSMEESLQLTAIDNTGEEQNNNSNLSFINYSNNFTNKTLIGRYKSVKGDVFVGRILGVDESALLPKYYVDFDVTNYELEDVFVFNDNSYETFKIVEVGQETDESTGNVLNYVVLDGYTSLIGDLFITNKNIFMSLNVAQDGAFSNPTNELSVSVKVLSNVMLAFHTYDFYMKAEYSSLSSDILVDVNTGEPIAKLLGFKLTEFETQPAFQIDTTFPPFICSQDDWKKMQLPSVFPESDIEQVGKTSVLKPVVVSYIDLSGKRKADGFIDGMYALDKSILSFPAPDKIFIAPEQTNINSNAFVGYKIYEDDSFAYYLVGVGVTLPSGKYFVATSF